MDSERILLRDACTPGNHKHALWNFLIYACGWHFSCLEPEHPYWLTHREHRKIADWVQGLLDQWWVERLAGVLKRYKILLWLFRGSGKSNLFTKGVPLFQMLREPNLAAVIGSETHDKAKEFLDPIKTWLDGSDPHALFTWLFGNWYNPERDWSKDKIVTAARRKVGVSEPSIGTFGVDTGITGKHPGMVNNDDPVSEEKLKEGDRQLKAAVVSHKSIYPALRNDSWLQIAATRYRELDVIGTILKNEGVCEWAGHPATEKFRQDGDWYVYHLKARDLTDVEEFPKGRPTLPELWDDAALRAYEASYPAEYAAQMMGDASTGEHMELNREQLENLFISRSELPPIHYATIHLDTAFKEDKTIAAGDDNVILTWLHDIRPNGMVYLDKINLSNRWRIEDFDTQLINTIADLHARGLRIRAITDDKEIGGKAGTFRMHLENVIASAGHRIPEILPLQRSGKRKIVRIRTGVGFVVEGYARLLEDCPYLDTLIDQLTHISTSAHDDVADAFVDVFIPDLWQPPQHTYMDEQPGTPVQPGDDILKGEFLELERQLRQSPRAARDNQDPQPYEDLLRKENS